MPRTVAGYFTEGCWRSDARQGPPRRVGSYRRTLAKYFNALAGRGMTLQRVVEPEATPSLARARPVWAEVPAVLVSRWRNAG